MIITAYHGTNGNFKKFDYSRITQNGAQNGAGIYLTSDKQTARAYGKNILKIDFEINKSFSNDKITITKEQLKNFIKNYVDPNGETLLNDFNDVSYYGYNNVLNYTVDLFFNNNNNDNNILSEIIAYTASRAENVQQIFDNIYNVFKKDFFYYETVSDGETIKNYIIFSNEQIKNISVEV